MRTQKAVDLKGVGVGREGDRRGKQCKQSNAEVACPAC